MQAIDLQRVDLVGEDPLFALGRRSQIGIVVHDRGLAIWAKPISRPS
ncbi:MAG: hypothetical protein M5U32_19285 [Myxococcota bacterium]|nr:hypothetical protein [Myxococcota bacterium]